MDKSFYLENEMLREHFMRLPQNLQEELLNSDICIESPGMMQKWVDFQLNGH